MKSRLLGALNIYVLRRLHSLAPVLIVLLAGYGTLFPSVSCASLVSSVLPTSRSVQIGDTATVFATVINTGPGTATGCSISPVTPVPATFLYQTTDPATNALTGTPNTPADIAEGAAQTFLFAFTPSAPFAPTDVELSFDCTNTSPAASISGLNTLLLSGSSTPVPDIIALATGTGILELPASGGGVGAFAVATVNVGATGTITASADTGSAVLPVNISVCQTNPVTGVCINPTVPASAATTIIAGGETPTFAFFPTASGSIPFDPANNRAFVSFKDGAGIVRGSTSTALISDVPGGFTIAELNEKGNDALRNESVMDAKKYYQAAIDLTAATTGNDADTARFMFALVRVSALAFDTLSDGDPDDMGRLGDMLDLFGFANDDSRVNPDQIVEPASLAADSPDGNDVRDFLYDVVRAELIAAAANLDQVSATFNAQIIDDKDEIVNVDHGDALFISGFFRLVVASIEILRAYNLGADIDDTKNNNLTAQDVQAKTPGIMGAPSLVILAEAKASALASLNNLQAAIASINGESDDQTDDLITLDDTSAIVAEMNTWIDETRASITVGATAINRTILNLKGFFDAGVLLDETTLPGLAGNGVDPANGLFEDPTLGGVVLDTDTTTPGIQDLNEDRNIDGIPDILQ